MSFATEVPDITLRPRREHPPIIMGLPEGAKVIFIGDRGNEVLSSYFSVVYRHPAGENGSAYDRYVEGYPEGPLCEVDGNGSLHPVWHLQRFQLFHEHGEVLVPYRERRERGERTTINGRPVHRYWWFVDEDKVPMRDQDTQYACPIPDEALTWSAEAQ